VRVLHVITGLGTGGAETQLRILLQHTRHDADVVSLHNPGAVAEQLRLDGVQVTDVRMSSNRDARGLARLLGVMRAGRYDVVHTHLYRACLYGRLAARIAGVPRIVATEHSLYRGQLEGRRATAGVRALYLGTERLGHCTIAVSRAVREELRSWGVPEERLVHIPNGLDLADLAFDAAARHRVRDEFGIPAGTVVIGAVGRLHPGKRFDELIEAAAPLLGPHRVLVIVGTGAEHAALTARARELGVADHVILAGERPVAPVLSAMDTFASPSSLETFGLAVIEALVNGLPVIYRRCPALDEIDVSGVPAVQVGDSVADLRAALQTHAVRPRTAGRPPAALAHLDIAGVAAAVDDLYEQLGAGARP
jgi:glycosyltransferase involved in cell wall biosynthesis